ncbi:hypothetical protein [Gordonia sp. 'Campus']|uniref:hypothetical protein n=1 Tax=Gordonia sp. 'Campus' TaxID=2915824 RepID=UPI001EE408D5|nr:hypothetical protein [Gordonia sp. 'Campus']
MTVGPSPEPSVVELATHPLILALPAVIPAFLLVGVIVVIAIADRRRGDDEDDDEDAAEDRDETPDPAAASTTDPSIRDEADDPERETD